MTIKDSYSSSLHLLFSELKKPRGNVSEVVEVQLSSFQAFETNPKSPNCAHYVLERVLQVVSFKLLLEILRIMLQCFLCPHLI